MAPADPVDALVVRWILSVPGYLLAITGGLTLVDRSRFRGRGLRVGIELALFTTASLVAVQFLVLGPAGRWSDVPATAQFVLAAGVVATSLTMAGALTVLSVIESRRRQAPGAAGRLRRGGRGPGPADLRSATGRRPVPSPVAPSSRAWPSSSARC